MSKAALGSCSGSPLWGMTGVSRMIEKVEQSFPALDQAFVSSLPAMQPVLCCKGSAVLHLHLPSDRLPAVGRWYRQAVFTVCTAHGWIWWIWARDTHGFWAPSSWKTENKKNEAVMNGEGCKSGCVILLSPERQKWGVGNLWSVVRVGLFWELCDISVSVVLLRYVLCNWLRLFPSDIWSVNY